VGAEGAEGLMGWKYETEVYMFEKAEDYDDRWVSGYTGYSLLKALLSIRRMRRTKPGRAYRLMIR
jgi:hypothetical protein